MHSGLEVGDLLRWAGLGLGLVSLVLLGIQWRLLRTGTRIPLRERLLMLAGLAITPASTLIVSQAVALERMKSVEFCNSCHVMTPYVESLRANEGVTLAALHVQNHRVDPRTACYTCHTQHSLVGPILVKMKGMRHLIRYYTRNDKDPIELYAPYPNANCLHCHGGARNFEEHPAHTPVMDQIVAGEMSCLTCHAAMHHQPEAK